MWLGLEGSLIVAREERSTAMSRVIQFPELNKGGLKAVAYGCQDVAIYDTVVDGRQCVWSELDLDDAKLFLDAVAPYLDAFKAFALDENPETKSALKAHFDALPAKYRSVALKLAFARYTA